MSKKYFGTDGIKVELTKIKLMVKCFLSLVWQQEHTSKIKKKNSDNCQRY